MFESKALDVLGEANSISERVSNIDSVARDLSNLINTAWYDDVGRVALSSLTRIHREFDNSAKSACMCVTKGMTDVRTSAGKLNSLSSRLDKVIDDLKKSSGGF